MTEIEKDALLLRCTLKKSWSVLGKVLKYGACLTVMALAGIFAVYGAISICELIVPGTTNAWQFLITVPWYVYVGIVVIAAIPVYSMLWCIARDLTEEDWESNAAEIFVIALATFAIFSTFTKPNSIWYYIGRFFGAAYHHYRKKNMPQLKED